MAPKSRVVVDSPSSVNVEVVVRDSPSPDQEQKISALSESSKE